MAIKLYSVKIEAYKEDEHMFSVEAFDANTATIEIKTVVNDAFLDELFSSIREAVAMMNLSKD